MTKYTILNIIKYKRQYIPLLLILILVLFIFLCIFAISENIKIAHEQHIGRYAAVAIVPRESYYNASSRDVAIIGDDFITGLASQEYIYDYYAFIERRSGSYTLEPYRPVLPENQWAWEIRSNNLNPMMFDLMIYSDIEKSTHFKLGSRMIAEGRFAENINECNISTVLAELNGLSVGDIIEINVFRFDPPNPGRFLKFEFIIVGIYEDNTDEVTNELALVFPGILDAFINHDGVFTIYGKHASQDNISRNQILTTLPFYDTDIEVFENLDIGYGFDALVFYVNDETSIFTFIDEFGDSLSEEYIVMDSADIIRSVFLISEKVQKSFFLLFVIASVICAVFSALLIFYILSNRIYDISVFRARGMPRVVIAAFVSSEALFVSLLSFTMTWVLYTHTFEIVGNFLYKNRGNSFTNMTIIYNGHRLNGRAFFDALINHELFMVANPYMFIAGVICITIFTAIIGLATVLFISRHEPIKTMTEY